MICGAALICYILESQIQPEHKFKLSYSETPTGQIYKIHERKQNKTK